MRWDNLLEDRADEEKARLPLFAEEALVRRFNTPEFRGMTFYEVRAKSIINHVKPSNLGFSWTINPYRGCSHACAYCLSGDTPILMADGRTKPLSEIRVGDSIYGTVRDGSYRRYVEARVLDVWKTLKSAYRVRLHDGTELIASADHRFLSNRGWKHVAGTQHGPATRPHLTANNALLGTGHFAEGPIEDDEYRRGYLTGMIRGDGHVGSYSYRRKGRTKGDVHRFRLALVDLEAIRRTSGYLSEERVVTNEFMFAKAAGERSEIRAIRTSAKGSVETVRKLISIPPSPTDSWRKGYLAGIYDAEGSYSGGIVRIANTDPELIGLTVDSLDRFGFKTRLETCHRPIPLHYIRILGGVVEHLRFFHLCDPAIGRKRSIFGQAIKNKADLRVAAIEPLGIELPMYDITTTTGDFVANGVVSHNCFARPTHTYLDMNAGVDFETKIVVKVNAVELLRRELRRPSWAGEHIAMGTNTDNYQRAEGRYRLMRGILAELNAVRNCYSILTKSTLIQRDIDLLVEGAAEGRVSASFSVGTVDEEVWRKTEPGTPHPLKRLEVVRKLNDAGVPCGILMAPILPGISDSPEQLKATVKAAVEAGATHITPIVLHLRKGVKEEFMPWLEETYPELVGTYREIYKGPNAPKRVAAPITGAVGNLRTTLGAKQTANHRSDGPSKSDRPSQRSTVSAPVQEQLTLDLEEHAPNRRSL
ncbi:MAG: intein-containing Rv2578c family radical SAM protein [Actinomycetota bacterium]|nr:intein-containing Rv2578c family radical SAM protein [Actinomycetota bacterium]